MKRSRTAVLIFAPLMLLVLAALLSAPAYSYLPSLTRPGPAPDHWDFTAFPVTWNLNPATGKNVAAGTDVRGMITAAFAAWTSAPNLALSVAEGPDTNVSSEASSPANMNVICFVCADADFAKDSNTLAVTISTTANATGESDGHGGATRFVGQIIKADIIFNPSVTFSGGTTGQNIQVIATHEIGHFFGLDHSAVVRAVMFPFASNLTTLSYDDVAGMSQLYPKASPDVATGTISGTVAFSNSAGVFGAHVYADSNSDTHAFAGTIRKTPVGTVTTPGGTYTIAGLPADSYIVVAEPLDEPVSNSDLSQFPVAYGQSAVQTNFTTRWH